MHAHISASFFLQRIKNPSIAGVLSRLLPTLALCKCARMTETEKQKAKPFLKWVGGKQRLADELLKHAPKSFGTYYEPFLGAGALFFALAPKRAVLSDSNKNLIAAYLAVRGNAPLLILHLETLGRFHNEKFFYETRDAFNDEDGREISAFGIIQAARFIYLNKACFNGLYRESAEGKLNVPFGHNSKPPSFNIENIKACQRALQSATLIASKFLPVSSRAQAGDFVYFDPPYVPISKGSNFTAYTADKFGDEDQKLLRDHALWLCRRGVHVMLSNSSAPRVADLYSKDFDLHEVRALRAVNSNGEGRGKVAEYIIVGRPQ